MGSMGASLNLRHFAYIPTNTMRWASVADGGPTLKQYYLGQSSCLRRYVNA